MCSVAPCCLTQRFGTSFPGICSLEEEPSSARAGVEAAGVRRCVVEGIESLPTSCPWISGSSYNLGLVNESEVLQSLPPNILSMWHLRARLTIQAGIWELAMLLGCSCCSPAALLWICSWPRWLQRSGLFREGWDYCRE